MGNPQRERAPPYSGAMAAVSEVPRTRSGSSDWVRKYPPLLSIFVALALAVAVLPSALNLPQTNPTQTLEYAPVPPDENEPPPPQGNLSALGLGSSSAVETGGAEGGNDLPPLPPLGKGTSPSVKRCVGNPPRQTEDPVAPPCVAYFEGDNFGSTYQGVTKEEIRLLVYIDSFIAETGGSKGREVRPEEEYFDLFEPAEDDEHMTVRAFRGWQRYFNERFQTYDRVVHFFLYFSARDKTPENRRADAADNFSKVRPFAVLTDANENEVDYVEAMAKKGVLNFGSFSGKSHSFFRAYPKLVWGYQPALERQAESYSTYVCTKVVGHPAAISGNPTENGQPRKLGLWHTDDENWPGLLLLADMVKKKVEACGGVFEAEGTFPRCCFAQDNSTRPDYAATQMAEFKQKGITTILWTGGMEGNVAKAAVATGYYPEWIILGDSVLEGNAGPRYAGQVQAFDDHAIVVTPEVFEPAFEQQRCYQAFREVDREFPRADVGFICDYYKNLFQLFTGIQVAGPRLGPTSIDKGYHAIPPVRSKDVTTPACFYDRDDYTCVKDSQVEIYDAQGQAPQSSQPGCWRSIEGAKRYLPGEWPKGNVNAQITGNEPCNGYSAGVLIDPA